MVPVESGTGAGSGGGACLPRPVVDEVERHKAAAYRRYLVEAGRIREAESGASRPRPEGPACRSDPDTEFAQFATYAWYSPLGYVPQVLGVGLGRLAGLGPAGMLLLARLATLAASIAISAIAIRRTPWAPWAFVAIGLLPSTLFQAATSISPDALTTAMAMLVLASALRITARPERPWAPQLAEAVGLTLVLALCKPTYVLVTAAYLMPLLRRPVERGRRLLLAAVPVLGLGVSALWQRSQRHLFICDTRLFGIGADPAAQATQILHRPHLLVAGMAEATARFGGEWLDDLIRIGDKDLTWSRPAVLVGVALFIGVATRSADRSGFALAPRHRALLGVLFLGGIGAVLGGWFLYCNSPTFRIDIAPSARLFGPFLPVLAVAVAPSRRGSGGFGQWCTALLVPFYLVWTTQLLAHQL